MPNSWEFGPKIFLGLRKILFLRSTYRIPLFLFFLNRIFAQHFVKDIFDDRWAVLGKFLQIFLDSSFENFCLIFVSVVYRVEEGSLWSI